MPDPPNVDRLIYEGVMRDLQKLWGGRLPTWNEFKNARKDGRVQVNKGIAQKAINLPGVPKGYYVVYGIITPWAMFLVPIISFILYVIGYLNILVVLGCFVGGYFLYKVTFVGAVNGILDGAEADEGLYQRLISNGAFLFGPPK